MLQINDINVRVRQPIVVVPFCLLVVVLAGSSVSAQSQPAATILLVTVVDAATQRPIPGAGFQYGYDYVFKPLKTDDKGQATAVVEAGHSMKQLWARVSAPNHVGQLVSGNDAKESGDRASFTMTVALAAGHTLGGMVVDVDGKPVPEAGVSFQVYGSKDQSPRTFVIGSADTDAKGHWSANVFPSDDAEIRLSVHHRFYAELEGDAQRIDKALRDQTSVITVHFPLAIEFTVKDPATGQRLTDRSAFRAIPVTTPESDRGSNTLSIGTGKGDFGMTFLKAKRAALRIEADGFESVTSPQVERDKDRAPLQWNVTLKRVDERK